MINQMEKLSSRKIDELGRIVLPSELRKQPGWGTGEKVAVYYVNESTLILQVPENKLKPRILISKKSTQAL